MSLREIILGLEIVPSKDRVFHWLYVKWYPICSIKSFESSITPKTTAKNKQ